MVRLEAGTGMVGGLIQPAEGRYVSG
jgi:hypothetical protein